MRPEKKYLVDEVSRHLGKSEYVFLTNFSRVTVEDAAAIRNELVAQKAEFHVVKNSLFSVAAKGKSMPDVSALLKGPTAIIVGGANPSEVAKVLVKFNKEKDKGAIKGGILGDRVVSAQEVEELSKLPDLDTLRAQLLGLLNTPAQQCVRVLNAVPQAVANVLDARRRSLEGGQAA